MTEEFSFHSREEKKHYVERMFSQIARRYDFFNHLLSLGFDYSWRKRAIQILKSHTNSAQPIDSHAFSRRAMEGGSLAILDIACGTGDLSFEALRQMPDANITGVDLAEPMLELFRKKAAEQHRSILIERGDVEALQFADNSFDGVTIGFGTRNFTDLATAFREIHRVLRPGGIFINLELARPRAFPMKQLYKFYFDLLLPKLARMFSGDRSAYRYLPDSLRRFPDLERLSAIMEEAGFHAVKWETRTAGIVAIHSGIK
ncbi:MAG TPA: bifunctional demethylmenaquinone methyltransferase/2-methoxy-6-polyprenyl-1,4-benzoquinol methylase UbiE [Candidatus Kapabacteria bacterium]|jgi:demethylmenaquinone methyltransferase/2-methoxy-6-polyprenyl-1,4-benzoquinol methylase